jgi:signal peptidase II
MARLILVTTLLVGCVGCDQITKVAARMHLRDRPAVSFLHDTFRLVYAQNPGAFLSAGASLPKPVRTIMFRGVAGLLVLGLIAAALLCRGLGGIQVSALTLLGASGLGNLIDRLLYDGNVTDFLNIGVGSLRTGIFNIADVVGVVGAIVLFARRSVGAASPHPPTFN